MAWTYFLIFCHVCLCIFEILFVAATVWVGYVVVTSCWKSEMKMATLEKKVEELLNE